MDYFPNFFRNSFSAMSASRFEYHAEVEAIHSLGSGNNDNKNNGLFQYSGDDFAAVVLHEIEIFQAYFSFAD